ncbi:hypothetical protein RJT34_04694 [Clitoria ternatea]|uniref:Uncharacterized protein n=1 Tax=Clitoria ternatea TaxID=43366 RepID=A0AAN9KLS9_CLITE
MAPLILTMETINTLVFSLIDQVQMLNVVKTSDKVIEQIFFLTFLFLKKTNSCVCVLASLSLISSLGFDHLRLSSGFKFRILLIIFSKHAPQRASLKALIEAQPIYPQLLKHEFGQPSFQIDEEMEDLSKKIFGPELIYSRMVTHFKKVAS